MFGLEKETTLKREIVETLDQESKFITTAELQSKIGHGSTNKILQTCRELKEIFNLLYPDQDSQIKIVINKHSGICLQRNTNDFHLFYIYLFKNDISYQIIRSLIISEVVSVTDLQDNLGVSFSGLQRKVRSINESISVFNLHISGTKNLYLRGEEKEIRIFFFIFLWGIHRQISNIDWVKQPDIYQNAAERISRYLDHPLSWVKNEQLAIWVYIFCLRINYQTQVSFDNLEQKITNLHQMPEKPDFLERWSQYDWQFLMLILWHSGIFDFKFTLKESEVAKFKQLNFINTWIELFERDYIKLSDRQQDYVKRKLLQQYVISVFGNFTITNASQQDWLYYFDGYLDPSALKHQKEYYSFWKEFAKKTHQKFLPVTGLNFLLFQSILPFNYFLPKVKVFLLSDLNEILEDNIKQQLSYTFSHKYKINFVTNIKSADIVLSTVPSSDPKIKKIKQPFIFIRSRLFSNDIQSIEQTLDKKFQ